jgi:8-oxo-dGTP diphosphatase
MLLLLYRCGTWTGEPRALDASALGWATFAELGGLPMPPADLPLIGLLERLV